MSALSPVSAALVNGLSLRDVVAQYLRKPEPVAPPKVAPLAKLSESDREAIAELMEVYGKICPQKRTSLVPAQLRDLMAERLRLDVVLKLLTTRKEGIRTTVLNHMDVVLEESGVVDGETPRDKDGHYLKAITVEAPGTHKSFVWEVSPGNPTFNVQRFYELCHTDGSGLTHKDWLACTYVPEVPRAFSEDKALDHLRNHPELVEKVAEAMEVVPPRAALNIRAEK